MPVNYAIPDLGPNPDSVWSTGHTPKPSGAIDPRGMQVPLMSELWPGMETSGGQFLPNPGNLDAPTAGAAGAYASLAEAAPTAAELASYRALAKVNPYTGVSDALDVYKDMVTGQSANQGPEKWLAAKAQELYNTPGYSGAQRSDISNATASAMTGQIAAAKDEMYRRAARSGNPMATYNAMASAGNKASDVMANAERQNRIAYADKAKQDQYNVMSQLAPISINAQNQRIATGAAGLLGAGGQAFGQGTGYANMINQFANSEAARRATGAAGLAGLYGQESQNLQNQYELLTKLMSQPVATETAGSKTGTGG